MGYDDDEMREDEELDKIHDYCEERYIPEWEQEKNEEECQRALLAELGYYD